MEVDEVKVDNKRPLIRLRCTRKRKFFAQPVKYNNKITEDSQDIRPDEERLEPTNKMIRDMGVQSVIDTESHATQTKRPWTRNQWIQTKPRERESTDTSLDGLEEGLKSVIPLVELCLQQNDLCNVFNDCWSELGTEDDGFGSKSDGHLREYQSFTDLKFSKVNLLEVKK